jgi:hypothetical protein
VVGGAWGLRLQPAAAGKWDLNDASQWGEPYLLLPADGRDFVFA